MWSAPRGYLEDKLTSAVGGDHCVEAGSNTSTVTLLVVGGDEKGSLESEAVKYGPSPKGLGPENDCTGEGQ
jgi:hypothetical protein